MLLGFVVSVFLSLILLFYIYRKYFAHKKLEKCRIYGPPPNWLLGNAHQSFSFGDDRLKNIREMKNKYGPTWGYYEGSTPIVVTADIALLQEIFIGQFSQFCARRHLPLLHDPEKGKNIGMFGAHGKRWKRLRTGVSHMFMEKELKALLPLADGCSVRFIQRLGTASKVNTTLDIYLQFQQLTLETILRTAFGNSIDEENSKEITKSFNDFSMARSHLAIVPLVRLIFPEFKPFFDKLFDLYVYLSGMESDELPYIKCIKQSINKRLSLIKEGKKVKTDILQNLLMSVMSEEESAKYCPMNAVKGLFSDEVIDQAVLFQFAGYETSSVTLTLCCHALVNTPRVLHKLVQESDKVVKILGQQFGIDSVKKFFIATCDKEVDDALESLPENFYDAVFSELEKCIYFDAVIYETLRFWSIASIVLTRRNVNILGKKIDSNEIISIKTRDDKLIQLPAGCTIIADAESIHHDQKLWGPENVKEFVPERMICEKTIDGVTVEEIGFPHPMAMVGFGNGPRVCIGKRFAMMEMRMSMCRLLTCFELSKSEQQGVDLDQIKLASNVVLTPTDGVFVNIKPRLFE